MRNISWKKLHEDLALAANSLELTSMAVLTDDLVLELPIKYRYLRELLIAAIRDYYECWNNRGNVVISYVPSKRCSADIIATGALHHYFASDCRFYENLTIKDACFIGTLFSKHIYTLEVTGNATATMQTRRAMLLKQLFLLTTIAVTFPTQKRKKPLNIILG